MRHIPVEFPNYTFRYVGQVNLARCLRWHPAGLNSWSLSDWAVALAGEVGEACDVIKKLNRLRDNLVGNHKASQLTNESLMGELANELADVYLYLDLLAQAAQIDLPAAIRAKFNVVSERNNFPERLI
jgi:NTP pyrophosphatase (non-canonical NTP hydrolase)